MSHVLWDKQGAGMQRRVEPQDRSPEPPMQDARAPVGRDGYYLNRALRGHAIQEAPCATV